MYYLFRTVGTVSHPSNNALSASTGTFSGAVSVSGAFTSQGIDDNADATAMTINSSETVMIGRTSTGYSNTGAQFTASGAQNIFVADGDFALGVARNTSDGKVFDIRKDGTAHGGIEVASSGSTLDVFFGNETRGLKFTQPIQAMVVLDLLVDM